MRVPTKAHTGWVYDFIVRYYDAMGYMPTLVEIAQAEPNRKRGVPVKSKAWVREALAELVQEGKVRLIPRKHRGIELV